MGSRLVERVRRSLSRSSRQSRDSDREDEIEVQVYKKVRIPKCFPRDIVIFSPRNQVRLQRRPKRSQPNRKLAKIPATSCRNPNLILSLFFHISFVTSLIFTSLSPIDILSVIWIITTFLSTTLPFGFMIWFQDIRKNAHGVRKILLSLLNFKN